MRSLYTDIFSSTVLTLVSLSPLSLLSSPASLMIELSILRPGRGYQGSSPTFSSCMHAVYAFRLFIWAVSCVVFFLFGLLATISPNIPLSSRVPASLPTGGLCHPRWFTTSFETASTLLRAPLGPSATRATVSFPPGVGVWCMMVNGCYSYVLSEFLCPCVPCIPLNETSAG